jgi:hypothetical protein
MSYRNPAVLQDTEAFNAKAKALQTAQKGSDDTFKPVEEEKLGDLSKDLNEPTVSQNESFVKPTSTLPTPPTPTSPTVSGAGTQVPGIDPSQSAFYKGNNPINNSSFYQNTFAPTDPNPPTLQEHRDDWADKEREATKPGADLDDSLKLL